MDPLAHLQRDTEEQRQAKMDALNADAERAWRSFWNSVPYETRKQSDALVGSMRMTFIFAYCMGRTHEVALLNKMAEARNHG